MLGHGDSQHLLLHVEGMQRKGDSLPKPKKETRGFPGGFLV